jgi:predicted XRE-type DNA-binding protein
MDKKKVQRLKDAGWAVGDAGDFLELSDEERAFIETKLALALAVRDRRKRRRLSQTELARRLGSSQSRVAKMEAADASVSLDLLVRSLLSLGATQADIAKVIRKGASRSAA